MARPANAGEVRGRFLQAAACSVNVSGLAGAQGCVSMEEVPIPCCDPASPGECGMRQRQPGNGAEGGWSYHQAPPPWCVLPSATVPVTPPKGIRKCLNSMGYVNILTFQNVLFRKKKSK